MSLGDLLPALPHLASYEVAVRLEELLLVPRFLSLYPSWHAARHVFPLLQNQWYAHQKDLQSQGYASLDQSLGASCALALTLLPFIEPGQVVVIPTLACEPQVPAREFIDLQVVKVLQPFSFTPRQVCQKSLAVPTILWPSKARQCYWCDHNSPHAFRFYQHAETTVQILSPTPDVGDSIRTWTLRQEFVLDQNLFRLHDQLSMQHLVTVDWWLFRFFLLAGSQALLLNAERIWRTQMFLHEKGVTVTTLPLYDLLHDFLLPSWFVLI